MRTTNVHCIKNKILATDQYISIPVYSVGGTGWSVTTRVNIILIHLTEINFLFCKIWSSSIKDSKSFDVFKDIMKVQDWQPLGNNGPKDKSYDKLWKISEKGRQTRVFTQSFGLAGQHKILMSIPKYSYNNIAFQVKITDAFHV